MAGLPRKYSDLDLNFSAHPVTGDVSQLSDSEAVRRSVRNLILTENYERFFQPDLGSGVTGLLFENFTPITAERIRRAILDTIERYEPRAEMLEVTIEANPERNGFQATIIFYVVNLVDPVSISVFLERVR